MTAVFVGGLVIAIVGVFVAVLADVLRLLEISRGHSYDQEESRG